VPASRTKRTKKKVSRGRAAAPKQRMKKTQESEGTPETPKTPETALEARRSKLLRAADMAARKKASVARQRAEIRAAGERGETYMGPTSTVNPSERGEHQHLKLIPRSSARQFTRAWADEIFSTIEHHMLGGATMTKACELTGLQPATLGRLRIEFPHIANGIAEAKVQQIDSLLSKLADIPTDYPHESSAEKRLRLDCLRTYLELSYPERFGKRMNVEIKQELRIKDALSTARQRAGFTFDEQGNVLTNAVDASSTEGASAAATIAAVAAVIDEENSTERAEREARDAEELGF